MKPIRAHMLIRIDGIFCCMPFPVLCSGLRLVAECDGRSWKIRETSEKKRSLSAHAVHVPEGCERVPHVQLQVKLEDDSVLWVEPLAWDDEFFAIIGGKHGEYLLLGTRVSKPYKTIQIPKLQNATWHFTRLLQNGTYEHLEGDKSVFFDT